MYKALCKKAATTGMVDEAIQKVASVAQDVNIPGAYIAGGWVRDRLLGKESKDVDITVENGRGIELAEAVAKAVGYKLDPTKDIYKAKGTAKVIVPTSEGNLLVEFVSARKETYAPEGHKPTEVEPGTIEEDVLRRDFTLNSLIVDIQDYLPGMSSDEFKGIVKDITGKGLDDLENKVLRTPLNPTETFEDDPTRIARAIRFAAQKGFNLSPEVEEAIKNGKSSTGELLRDMLIKGRKAPKGTQIGDELRKAFLGNPIKTIRLLKDTGLGDSLGMELKKLDVDQVDYRGLHSKDVYEHSVQALQNMIDQINEAKRKGEVFDEDRELALILSAVYHDIGKQEAQQIVCGGKVGESGKREKCDYVYKPGEDTSICPKCGAKNRAKIMFVGHEFKSKYLIDPILERFFGKRIREKVKNLVVNHMAHHNYSRDRELELEKLNRIRDKALQYGDMHKVKSVEEEIRRKEALIDIPSSRNELARLVEVYEKDPDIRFLWQADLTTKDRKHKTQRKLNIDKMIESFEEFGPVQSALDGKEIMEIFNIPPGPIVKKVLEQLKQLKIKNSKYSDPKEVREYLKDKQLNEEGLIITKRPMLDGNDLMSLYNKRSGPWLQPMLQRLREETLKGTFNTKEDAVKWLKEHESEFGNLREEASLRTLSAAWTKEWQKCPKCKKHTYLMLRNPETGEVKQECKTCGYPEYAFGKQQPYVGYPPNFFEALEMGDYAKAQKIAEEFAKKKNDEPEVSDLRSLSMYVRKGIRGLSTEAINWIGPELQTAKDYYLQQREKGRKDDGIIYQEIAEKINRTPRAVKQKIEYLKNTDDTFKQHKLKHWTYQDVMKELKDIYRSNSDNFHRTALPEDLRSQIKHRIGEWFHNFDVAMAKAIREVENEKGNNITMDDALKMYLHQHKLAHRWNKNEIVDLFKAAHESGLPVTRNFFAKQPEVYKPILGVNRSLEGLKDSVKRYFGSWGDAVVEAGLVDNKYYNDEGRPLGSTEEVRLARFFDLNNIKYRRCTAMDKIAINDPEILELGYRNFLADFYILDDGDKEIALVEVFGSITNSGKVNPVKNKTIGELYKEKREAKIRFYSTLDMPFVYIDNDEDKGLSDNSLKEKFAKFIRAGTNIKGLSKIGNQKQIKNTIRKLAGGSYAVN